MTFKVYLGELMYPPFTVRKLERLPIFPRAWSLASGGIEVRTFYVRWVWYCVPADPATLETEEGIA